LSTSTPVSPAPAQPAASSNADPLRTWFGSRLVAVLLVAILIVLVLLALMMRGLRRGPARLDAVARERLLANLRQWLQADNRPLEPGEKS
jgi:hypothetical protein